MVELPIRELDALRSCIITWRRALLELRFQSGEDRGQLAAEHGDLVAYADAAGEAAPFTRAVLAATIGDLEQRVLLTALYRTEVAMSIAWALTLVETIKPPEEPADLATLDALLPLYAAPSERIASAALRAARVIAEHHARTSELLARARDRHAQHPDDREAGMQLSRAFWRHYGLQWLLGSTSHVEETQVPAF